MRGGGPKKSLNFIQHTFRGSPPKTSPQETGAAEWRQPFRSQDTGTLNSEEAQGRAEPENGPTAAETLQTAEKERRKEGKTDAGRTTNVFES